MTTPKEPQASPETVSSSPLTETPSNQERLSSDAKWLAAWIKQQPPPTPQALQRLLESNRKKYPHLDWPETWDDT